MNNMWHKSHVQFIVKIMQYALFFHRDNLDDLTDVSIALFFQRDYHGDLIGIPLAFAHFYDRKWRNKTNDLSYFCFNLEKLITPILKDEKYRSFCGYTGWFWSKTAESFTEQPTEAYNRNSTSATFWAFAEMLEKEVSNENKNNPPA